MFEEKGQITARTNMAQILQGLAMRQDFMTYVEVGTWKGQGSTKCIADELILRNDDSQLYSVEMRKDMYEEAKMYWDCILLPMPFKRDKVNLLNGVIVDETGVMSEEEFLKDLKALTQVERADQYRTWHKEMVEGLKNKEWPNVIDRIPNNIDVLLLDSGELTSQAEFYNLSSRGEIKFVILDDVLTVKNFSLNKELCASKDWKLIDFSDRRHGYSVFLNSKYEMFTE